MAKAKNKECLISLKVRTTGRGGRANEPTWSDGWGQITWQNGGSLPQTVRRQALKELKKKLAA